MRHLLDATELLIASWILGGAGDKIPTSNGILDRALKAAVADEKCPTWLREQLHFVDSRIGLRCVELPAILEWAQRAQFASAPNPSYQLTQVQVSESTARKLLLDLDVSEEKAVEWGRLLKRHVEIVQNSTTANVESSIEEY